MKDFLFFKSFIALTLIKVCYYLAMLLLGLAYLAAMVLAAINEGVVQALIVAVVGFLALILYGLILRVWAEIAIVVFRIHEELKELNAKS